MSPNGALICCVFIPKKINYLRPTSCSVRAHSIIRAATLNRLSYSLQSERGCRPAVRPLPERAIHYEVKRGSCALEQDEMYSYFHWRSIIEAVRSHRLRSASYHQTDV